jgi:hypothetical protein
MTLIEQSEFPMGVIQTWVDTTKRGRKKLEKQLLSIFLLSTGLGRKFVESGVRLYEVDKKRLEAYLIDTFSGLPFILDNDFLKNIKKGFDPKSGKHLPESRLRLNPAWMYTHELDVIDACYYRDRLRNSAPSHWGIINPPILKAAAIDLYTAAYGTRARHFLSAPIADYEASTFEECEAILASIKDNLQQGAYFRRLWLRGQRQEYTLTRDKRVCALLGFGREGATQPSLIPSLGRFALNNPGKVNYGYALVGPNHYWKKPFLIWVIRQNPHWLYNYPEFAKRIEKSLRDDDDSVFAKILADIMTDPRVPTEVDDLRQWFFAHFKHGSWIAVLQQYGYLASMLDVTWDLDTALFFTQAKMVNNRFRVSPPAEGRVIYVFAQSGGSRSFFDMNSIDWGDDDWVKALPPRIAAQRCGCITGSTIYRKNMYGHLVIARIYLKGNKCVTTRTPEEVFPSKEEDLLYRTLLESRPKLEGLY